MKKLISLILALAMCFALCACGGENASDGKETEDNTATTEKNQQNESTEGTNANDDSEATETGETDPVETDSTLTEPPATELPVTEPVATECSHAWADATCTTPKTCSVCGATDGAAKGHSYADATCTAPKTCSVCGATDGVAKGHSYSNGSCVNCGAADENYKTLESGIWANYSLTEDGDLNVKIIRFDGEYLIYMSDSAFDITILSEEMQKEIWEDEPARIVEYQGGAYVLPMASMSVGAVYTVNGSEISAATEDWGSGTITLERKDAVTLVVTETTGEVFSGLETGTVFTYEEDVHKHFFSEAGCVEPQTCYVCGETKGEPAGHNFYAGNCLRCDAVNPEWMRVTSNDGIFSIAIPKEYESLVTNSISAYSDGIVMVVHGIEHDAVSFSMPIEFVAVLNSERESGMAWGDWVNSDMVDMDGYLTSEFATNGEYTILCKYYPSASYVVEGEDAEAYIQAILDMRTEFCDSLQWE